MEVAPPESPSEGAPRRYSATIASGGALAGVRDVLARFLWAGLPVTFVLAFVGVPGVAAAVAVACLCLWAVVGLSRVASRVLSSNAPAVLSVRNDALFVDASPDRQRQIRLETLRSGRVLRGTAERGARVVLRGRWGRSLVARLDAADDARALLRELRLSAREHPATFAFFFGLRVTVGADGILMEWPLLRRRRFVPYSKVLSMTPSPGMIVFRLRGGDRYEIMTTTSRRSVALEQHEALVERIEDACSSYRAENAEPALAALMRAGRSALGWVKDLRALSEASGSAYRAATLPGDALWNIALDPTATEEMRIGAGLALRGTLDDDGRARLRVAAEASASPKVRVVLEAAAEGVDDDQLGETIAGAVPMRRR